MPPADPDPTNRPPEPLSHNEAASTLVDTTLVDTPPRVSLLPREFWELLPSLGSLAEVKVLLVALRTALELGRVESPYSLRDYMAATNLDHKGTRRGLHALCDKGILRSRRAGRRRLYTVVLLERGLDALSSSVNRGLDAPLSGLNRGMDAPLSDVRRGLDAPYASVEGGLDAHACMHDLLSGTLSVQNSVPEHAGEDIWPSIHLQEEGIEPSEDDADPFDGWSEPVRELYSEIETLGVASRVIEDLLRGYMPEYLREHLEQTRCAISSGLARQPAAWFISSVRDDWPPPPGFDQHKRKKSHRV